MLIYYVRINSYNFKKRKEKSSALFTFKKLEEAEKKYEELTYEFFKSNFYNGNYYTVRIVNEEGKVLKKKIITSESK